MHKLDGFFSDLGLRWIRKAWNFIENSPLSEYTNDQEYYLVTIRLFCLGEIVRVYHTCISESYYNYHEHYTKWVNGEDKVDGYKIDYTDKLERIKYVILAGEEYYSDEYLEDDGICHVIDHLIEEEYENVLMVVISGFGGKEKFFSSLKDIFNFQPDMDPDKLSYWYEENFYRHIL